MRDCVATGKTLICAGCVTRVLGFVIARMTRTIPGSAFACGMAEAKESIRLLVLVTRWRMLCGCKSEEIIIVMVEEMYC